MFLSLFLNATFRKDFLNAGKFAGRLRRYGSVLFNYRAQTRILDLLQDDALADLPHQQPEFPFKYLNEGYLCLGLTTRLRARILVNHYDFLRTHFDKPILQRLISGQSELLFTAVDEERDIAIVLRFSNPIYAEGELSVVYQVNGRDVFVLSFTFVPGDIAHLPAPQTILISRMQGVKGFYDDIQRANRWLKGVDPQMALIDAVQGFAMALGIRYLLGISAEEQPAFTIANARLFTKAYDEFFLSNGFSRTAGQFFQTALPLARKPLKDIKPGNRPRSKAQRLIRQDVSDAAYRAVQSHQL